MNTMLERTAYRSHTSFEPRWNANGAPSPASHAKRRRLCYLVSQYPKVSHSFIRREILALERRGWQIAPGFFHPRLGCGTGRPGRHFRTGKNLISCCKAEHWP